MSADQKIKTAAGKPPLGMVPAQALIGPSRVYGYGGRKYAPGNYYNATLDDGAGARYVSAALRHLGEMQLPNGLHTPESLAMLDPESGLPHLDHAICGLLMLRAIMIKCGALPADPGEGNDPHALKVPESLAPLLDTIRFVESLPTVEGVPEPILTGHELCTCAECERYRITTTCSLDMLPACGLVDGEVG